MPNMPSQAMGRPMMGQAQRPQMPSPAGLGGQLPPGLGGAMPTQAMGQPMGQPMSAQAMPMQGMAGMAPQMTRPMPAPNQQASQAAMINALRNRPV